LILLLIIASYLLGSLSSAIIICQLLGLADPRTQGSGNPGATNVLRYAGKKAAALTLGFDILKGLFAVLITFYLGFSDAVIAACAVAVFMGHLYPIFFNFRGGKGVATGFGALLGVSVIAALLSLLTWLLMAYISRYSSLAALSAALSSPIYIYITSEANLAYIIAASLISTGLFMRHRDNIIRLLQGQEPKIK